MRAHIDQGFALPLALIGALAVAVRLMGKELLLELP